MGNKIKHDTHVKRSACEMCQIEKKEFCNQPHLKSIHIWVKSSVRTSSR